MGRRVCFRRVTVLCAQDAFIRLRTGAMTMHTLPFANSDLSNSARDGQFYRLRYLLGFFLVDEVNRDCRWALLGIRAAEMRGQRIGTVILTTATLFDMAGTSSWTSTRCAHLQERFTIEFSIPRCVQRPAIATWRGEGGNDRSCVGFIRNREHGVHTQREPTERVGALVCDIVTLRSQFAVVVKHGCTTAL
jgi:hypothetical protein